MTEPSSNGSSSPDVVLRAEEATVTAILQSKFAAKNCLLPEDQQIVAYRIAEIMVTAKELYTKELPRISSDDHSQETDIFEELAGLRMTFLHLRDLITDFDESFMIAMSHQREVDQEGPQPPSAELN